MEFNSLLKLNNVADVIHAKESEKYHSRKMDSF